MSDSKHDPISAAARILMHVMEHWPRNVVMPASVKVTLEQVETAISDLLDEARHEGVQYEEPPRPPPRTLRLVK